MSAAVQPAVVGATGYAGGELVKLLSRHPSARQPLLFGRRAAAADENAPLDFAEMKRQGVDVLFLATPHDQSREWVPEALEQGLRVVDLSGAWRLNQAENRKVYNFADEGSEAAQQTQAEALYGLPELNRKKLGDAILIANPGCYATSIILALAPLLQGGMVDADRGIISDSKSGVSGAGKKFTETTHFMSVAENLSAYGVYAHRHTGELVEQLGVGREQITFTPHLLPIQRGMMSTIYVTLAAPADQQVIEQVYESFFAASPMVRLQPAPELPQIRYSAYTNFCDIGFAVAPEGKRVTIVSCLDNLLKGAAGQAVQNMNLMFGFGESEGLQ